ncbi:putative cupredoxin-like copper-binding protein [Nocardiopsis mwathae]|uniref:Putative cupredoxin-like copper-binding protein n=1 Tax=Nocardiopsis mwathae TaxID=1472723 RepID=A0A7X0D697_9ACTN|nr:cupredoxin domain-containing protein [Nocardiopsis mwathae]MBB6171874.1 putative cupredoxin-like copper-binding protein [Nocardiopsis mwathae]
MSRLALSAAALAVLLGLAACGTDEPEPATQDDVAAEQDADNDTADDTDAATDAETISVDAGEMYFEGVPDTVPAGTITFELNNVGNAPHDLVIEEHDDHTVAEVGPGESASGTVELEPGTYTLYCSIGNHRQDGMEVTITVE